MKNEECIEETVGQNVVVKENGRRINFLNPDRSKFKKIKVDNCLIIDGERSDWIVTKVGVGSVVVELKGKDVDKACHQLWSTLAHPDCCGHLEKKRALVVVASRVPSLDTSIQRHKNKARQNGLRLEFICQNRDVLFEDILGL